MKITIRGFRYDTGTAERICGTEGEQMKASLYRTRRSGRFFLAGSGGPMTLFARKAGAEAIIPVDNKTAREFARGKIDEADEARIFKG